MKTKIDNILKMNMLINIDYKIGDFFDVYYSNGVMYSYLMISRMTDKSVFEFIYDKNGNKFNHEFRESHNTFKRNIINKLYKKK